MAEHQAVSRGRRPATHVATASLLLGVVTALAGTAVWRVADDGRLMLVAGTLDGDTLAPLLWLGTCGCALVLGVVGFRLFVIGYEARTAALAAIFLCALVLAAVVAALVAGFLALVGSDGSYTTLRELDRPADRQVVIEDTGSTYDPDWRFYVGGPFVFEEIFEGNSGSSMTTAPCTKLNSLERTAFGSGEYLLTTDERGRDVITFTTDGLARCDHKGVPERVLPD